MITSNIKILFCGMLKSPFILRDLELLQQYYEVIPVNLDIVQESREGFIIYIWSVMTRIIFKLRHVDLVYIWFADIHTFPLLVLAKLFKKKSIVLIGGWEVANYPEINYGNQSNMWRGAITRWCIRNSDIVIVTSLAYKNITKSIEPKSNICIIPMTIDKSLCEYPLPIKSNKIVTALFTLKFTGTLKGIPIFKAAEKEVPYECIIYEGIPHDILMDKLREAKVYCQLSYTESFGVTNLEAMACGCVPIVTNRDALPEIIGDTGLVVPYGDVQATVDAMYKAMTMDGTKARERSKLFLKENRIKMLTEIIKNDYIDEPLVSVVIPAYNAAQWLPDTIGSILNQTYPNVEIIVVDDCSTDNTYDIVSKFDTIKYIKNSVNMGECFSSRRGFDEAKGYYICRLSADDMYANPDKIKHQVESLEKSGGDFSYNSINCIGETIKTSVISETYWMVIPTRYGHKVLQLFDKYILKFPHLAFLRILLGNPINSSTLMFRKSSYMRSEKWTTGETRTDCDGLLLYNLFLQKFKCVVMREMGSFYRLHPDQATNISLTYKDDMHRHKLEVINKVLYGVYPLWLKFMVKIIKKKI
jgi:glycosyltransferase involved in cell wall biosynthesis